MIPNLPYVNTQKLIKYLIQNNLSCENSDQAPVSVMSHYGLGNKIIYFPVKNIRKYCVIICSKIPYFYLIYAKFCIHIPKMIMILLYVFFKGFFSRKQIYIAFYFCNKTSNMDPTVIHGTQ